jgi:hypothetical protein
VTSTPTAKPVGKRTVVLLAAAVASILLLVLVTRTLGTLAAFRAQLDEIRGLKEANGGD